jgi:hypothetical protein
MALCHGIISSSVHLFNSLARAIAGRIKNPSQTVPYEETHPLGPVPHLLDQHCLSAGYTFRSNPPRNEFGQSERNSTIERTPFPAVLENGMALSFCRRGQGGGKNKSASFGCGKQKALGGNTNCNGQRDPPCAFGWTIVTTCTRQYNSFYCQWISFTIHHSIPARFTSVVRRDGRGYDTIYPGETHKNRAAPPASSW